MVGLVGVACGRGGLWPVVSGGTRQEVVESEEMAGQGNPHGE